jgi:glycosyltransferase involved in cell wall biosynthesis
MSIKRIICLIGQLGNGGTEKQLFLFLKHLDRSHYEAFVVVSGKSGGKWERPIKSLGVPIFELGTGRKISKLLKFRKKVKELNAELIFSWNFFTNVFWVAVPRLPFIGSLRGDLCVAKKELGFFSWRLALCPGLFVVNSSKLEDDLKNYDVMRRKKIFKIRNIFDAADLPADDEDREKIRKKYAIPADAKVLIGAGRDTPEKNFKLFLEVFAEILKKKSSVYAFIIGSCGEKLKVQADEMGLKEKLILPGEVENPFEYFRAADTFFISSKTEGMPNVLLEAVSCGCSAAAMDTGGIEEIFQKNSKKFIVFSQTEPPEKIASGITRLMEKQDKMMPVASSELLKDFTPEKIMPKYYEVLDFAAKS